MNARSEDPRPTPTPPDDALVTVRIPSTSDVELRAIGACVYILENRIGLSGSLMPEEKARVAEYLSARYAIRDPDDDA